MSNFVCFILFLFAHFFTLYSWEGKFFIFSHGIHDDSRGIIYTADKKCIFIPNFNFNLDFSNDFPDLEMLRFPNESYDVYKKCTNDLGLSNNPQLKELQFLNEGFSILRWASLPNIEILKLTGLQKGEKTGFFYDLSFLEHSLPCLKTISIFFPQAPSFGEMFEIPFESMSKLSYLENLSISLRFGVLAFSEKDFKAISKLQHLKTLKIRFVSYQSEPSVEKLTSRLQSILPKTIVEVKLAVVRYPDDPD